MSNIKVYCRIRPTKKTEIPLKNLIVSDKSVSIDNKDYVFNAVFNENITQTQIYEKTTRKMVNDLLVGYNCTIFAYGLTGTGKTYTILGTPKNPGLMYQLCNDILETLGNSKLDYQIGVTFLEIYLEKLHDLLSIKDKNLRIRESKYKGIWVEGLRTVYVSTIEDIMDVIKKGINRRTTAKTNMNDRSSRSHAVFTLNIDQFDPVSGAKIHSKLVLVDLAGSESVKQSGATGLTLKQAQHTNKSLLTLGTVIRSLHDNSTHVPYRDSKLTRIISDSLGGNSETALFVTCSACAKDLASTISSFRFGSYASKIENNPYANVEHSIEEYKRLLAEANERLRQYNEGEIVVQELQGIVPDLERLELEKENEHLKEEKYDLEGKVIELELELDRTKELLEQQTKSKREDLEVLRLEVQTPKVPSPTHDKNYYEYIISKRDETIKFLRDEVHTLQITCSHLRKNTRKISLLSKNNNEL